MKYTKNRIIKLGAGASVLAGLMAGCGDDKGKGLGEEKDKLPFKEGTELKDMETAQAEVNKLKEKRDEAVQKKSEIIEKIGKAYNAPTLDSILKKYENATISTLGEYQNVITNIMSEALITAANGTKIGFNGALLKFIQSNRPNDQFNMSEEDVSIFLSTSRVIEMHMDMIKKINSNASHEDIESAFRKVLAVQACKLNTNFAAHSNKGVRFLAPGSIEFKEKLDGAYKTTVEAALKELKEVNADIKKRIEEYEKADQELVNKFPEIRNIRAMQKAGMDLIFKGSKK